ncbi:MAG: helix-turn-helix domain-containing protein, partial [Candidatus Bipolaricaulis sp.]|nr:helix-turn-helix domain-containing protein [Candidatus Bipolaricaulis sp.]
MDNDYLNGYAKIFGPTGTAVYISFCRHSDNETQKCFPSQKLIAEENGIGTSIVKEYIKLLEKCHIIFTTRSRDAITKRWRNIEYELVDKKDWISIEIATKIVEDYREKKREKNKKNTHSHIVSVDSHSHIDSNPQPHRFKSHSHIVSNKETHINYTHINNTNREETETLTPYQEMKLFINSEEYFYKIVKYFIEKGLPEQAIIEELTKFKNYWMELNKTGRKQRWELQPTFQLKRRLMTWFSKASQFSQRSGLKGKPIYN